MRILVLWDNDSEAELIQLYLNVGNDETRVLTDTDTFLAEVAVGGHWDVLLMPTNRPDHETALTTFLKVRNSLPDCPIVGACHLQDMFRLAGFLTHGLRTYVVRDDAGDFLFLLQATLQSTVDAMRAERERMVSERLREEIESVRKLQESIMPRDLRSPAGYRICGRYESSQIRVFGGQPVILAGGDYYDVFTYDDEHAAVLLGDASGHGMKACMSIMTMHTLVKMFRESTYEDTAAFVNDINRRLYEQTVVNDDGGFITMMYGHLDSTKHEFQWTSAGHPLPILLRLDEGTVETQGTNDDAGMPLGVVDEWDYDWCTVSLPPRSRLLVYTDGLEEAFPDGDMDLGQYGIEGIKRTMLRTADKPLDEALEALFNDSHAFTNGNGRHDDTTVLLLERD